MPMKMTAPLAVLSLVLVGSMFALGGSTGEEQKTTLTTTWGQPPGGFKLGITVAKNSFRVGEPIIVSAVLRNVSDKRRKFDDEHSGRWWRLEVKNIDRGIAIPQTLGGTLVYGGEPPPGGDLSFALRESVSSRWLEPGESTDTVLLWVSRLRDMTLRGKYSITISHLVRTEGNEWVKAAAGPVQIEIDSDGYSAGVVLQTLQLDPHFYEAGGSSWGPYLGEPLGEELEQIAKLSEEHPGDATARAVRSQLEELRDRLDALLKKGPPGAEAPAGAKAQPPMETPRPRGRPNLRLVPD